MKTLFVCAALLLLAACNTIAGMGQDVKSAGSWTNQEAVKVKNKM